MTETIIVSPKEMNETFTSILLANGFQLEKAKACAEVFTSNSIDGVYSHGVNRFARFIASIQNGYVKINAESKLIHGLYDDLKPECDAITERGIGATIELKVAG